MTTQVETGPAKSRMEILQDLLAGGIKPQSRRHVIKDEIESLSSLFNSLAETLVSSQCKHQKIYSAEDLSRIFGIQSIRSGSFVSSSFKIISKDDHNKFKLNSAYQVFSTTNNIHGRDFVMGFIQVNRTGTSEKKEKIGYSVPIIALHTGILESITPFAPEKMIAALERLYTYANHDWLHHYTSDGINKKIADTDSRRSLIRKDFMSHFGQADDNPLSYESFMIESHAHTFRHAFATDENFRNTYLKTLDDFFSELKIMVRAMKEADPKKHFKNRTRDVTAYFGQAALFSMMRLFKTNDEIFINAADTLHAVEQSSVKPIPGMSSARKHISAVKRIAPEFQYLMPKTIPGTRQTIERREMLERLMIDSVAVDIAPTEIKIKNLGDQFKKLTSEEDIHFSERERIIESLHNGIEWTNYDPAILGLEGDIHPIDMHRMIDETSNVRVAAPL